MTEELHDTAAHITAGAFGLPAPGCAKCEAQAAHADEVTWHDAIFALCDCGDFDGHPGDCDATALINLRARLTKRLAVHDGFGGGPSCADRLAQVTADRDVVVKAVADVVRDHTMPPNKDRHGYDYRMGWWDAVVYLDALVKRRTREARAALMPAEEHP